MNRYALSDGTQLKQVQRYSWIGGGFAGGFTYVTNNIRYKTTYISDVNGYQATVFDPVPWDGNVTNDELLDAPPHLPGN